MDSGAAGLELMIKGFVSARQQIAFMEQGGYSEIMSQLQGPGVASCTSSCSVPCAFDLGYKAAHRTIRGDLVLHR